MNVVRPLFTNSRPVNLQAAKIFWKSPWWAKLPPEDKSELVHSKPVKPAGIEDFIEVTKAPPKRPGNIHHQIEDLRGRKLKHKDTGQVALVLGYAHTIRDHYSPKKIKGALWWNGQSFVSGELKVAKMGNTHRWYAFFGGEVSVIKHTAWKEVGNYEPITKVRIEPRSTSLERSASPASPGSDTAAAAP